MRKICLALSLGFVGASVFSHAQPTSPPPDFGQVRELIKANLPGVTEAELNQFALDGLLQGLRGKVRLLDPAATESARVGIAKASLLDEGIAYLRVEHFYPGLPEEVRTACQNFNATNRLKGVVLDVRFAAGDDYAAALRVVDLFVADEQAWLDWGAGVGKSTAKTNALPWPVAVLINSETTGAPEALAALARETGTGLLLGNPTRGAAMTTKEFSLSDGRKLRIASAPVKVRGAPLPASGVVPDIQVAVTTAEERLYFNDAFAVLNPVASVTNLTASGTNRVVRRVRTTEADLVRARREGVNFNPDQPLQRETEVEKPVIRDPALARAVDLLKGLAVVRRTR